MKKVKLKSPKTSIAITLIIAIFVLAISPTISYASETESYSTCAEHYFTKLENNIPKNRMSSCAYVAMSMLLYFYDFYWNDTFVHVDFEDQIGAFAKNETYPVFIPKMKLENDLWNEHVAHGGDYNSLIAYYALEYLHLYLINLGIELDYHTGTSADEDYAITLRESKAILENYFSLREITSEQITVNIIYESFTTSRSDVIDVIRTQVQAGNPVYFRGDKIVTKDNKDSGDKKFGHAMIAYGLDGDDIKLHTGWINENSDEELKYFSTINTTEYQYNIGALWLEINEDAFPHVCSDSFQEMSSLKNMCSCQAYHSLHPSHTHKQFTCVSNSYTSTSHTAKCICGATFSHPHNYVYRSLDSATHSYSCGCGYSGTESHTLVTISPKYMKCEDCGYLFDRLSGGFVPNPLETVKKEEET